MSFRTYVNRNWSHIVTLTGQHARLVATAMVIAMVIGVTVGAFSYRSRLGASVAVASASALFTVPSLALAGLLIPTTGLTYRTVLVMLVLYSLVPIIRNTVVGLRGVDPALIEAARGTGMSRLACLGKVELPLAWPVVLTGVRVSAQLTLGIATIAVYVTKVGLGVLIDQGLTRFGLPNSINQALAGTLGVVVLALVFDLAFQVMGRVTTPRGIRA